MPLRALLLVLAFVPLGCEEDDSDPIQCSCNTSGVFWTVIEGCELEDNPTTCNMWEILYCSEEPERCDDFTRDTEFSSGTRYAEPECTLEITCPPGG